MRSRHIMGAAILCGAFGTLGGQTVQAQTPNSTRFVNLLLLNESAQIAADTKALNTLNATIARLDSATSTRNIRSLSRTISRLNTQILRMTAELVMLSTQTYTTAVKLNPSNSALVSQALAGLRTVQSLSLSIGLGIAPASPSQ